MNLSPRDRRALLIGAAAAVSVLTYAFAVRPLTSRAGDLKERREVLVESLARYASVLAAQDAYETASDTARARLLRLAPGTFSGAPEEATASLLTLVGDLAAKNLIRVVRTIPLPPESAAGDVVAVGARVECESDLAGAVGLLRALEASNKLVHVSELELSEQRSARRVEGAQVLRIQLTVKGFLLASPTENSGDTEDARAPHGDS